MSARAIVTGGMSWHPGADKSPAAKFPFSDFSSALHRRRRRLLGEGSWWDSALRTGMAAQGADLYESLKIKYPRGSSQAPAPGSVPPWRRALGPALALGTVLALGVSLAAVGALYVRAERELRAARAAAAGASALPGCALNASHGQWLQWLSIGWKYHDGKIYYFSSDRKPWQEAEDFCVSKQSHLTSVTSAEEQEYLTREGGKRSYWIGLTKVEKEGTWRWVDGTKYSENASFWAPGQPDNTDYGPSGREECAQIHPVGNGLWNDHNCNVSFLWICKRHLDTAGL
ncbi:C-type lectin domain family 4 member K-like isoform X1 [Apteryx mantelli]|uniref:C-type lectin domain family 4 member K-like isoform X1 n=1 Tax=Apteryx mantelli TaxID=2696672 RepID=A0ABM4EKW4_9AVES